MSNRSLCLLSCADIPLPEADGRLQLFNLNLEKVDVATDVDFDKLVAATEVRDRAAEARSILHAG
jgi:ATP-dependent 26S proteasome regulatory subunit